MPLTVASGPIDPTQPKDDVLLSRLPAFIRDTRERMLSTDILNVNFESNVETGDAVYLDPETHIWKRSLASTDPEFAERYRFHGIAHAEDQMRTVRVFGFVSYDFWTFPDDAVMYVSPTNVGKLTHEAPEHNKPLYAGVAVHIDILLVDSSLSYWEELRNEIWDARGTFDVLDDRLVNTEGQLETVQLEIANARGEHATLSAHLNHLTGRIVLLENEVETARSTFGSIGLRLDDMTSRISSLESSVSILEGNVGRFTDIEDEIEEARDGEVSLFANLDKYHSEVRTSRGVAENLNARLSVGMNPDGTLKSTVSASIWATDGDYHSRVSDTIFRVTGDKRSQYRPDVAVRFNNDMDLIGWVDSTSYDSINDRTSVEVDTVVLPDTITQVEHSFAPEALPRFDHSDLSGIEGLDINSSDETVNKHVSNNLMKTFNSQISKDITTNAATLVSGVTARLWADVLRFGLAERDAFRVFFYYKKDYQAEWSETEKLPVTELGEVYIDVDSLDPETIYEFKAVAHDELNPTLDVEGAVLTFNTSDVYVEQPTVSVEQLSTEVVLEPLIESDAFSVFGASDVHLSSDWVVRLGSNNEIIWAEWDDTENLTSKQYPLTLDINTEYIFQVRHRGTTYDYSSWGSLTITSVNTHVAEPVLTVSGSPDTIITGPTLSGDEFTVVAGSDTHQDSDWQVVKNSDASVAWQSLADSENLTSIDIPSGSLDVDTEYTFKLRYRGTTFGESAWAEVVFTTADTYVDQPTLTVEGSPSDVPEQPTLQTSTFAVVGPGSDTHESSDWVVRNSADTATVWESLADTSNKLSITAPAETLSENTEYIFRVRHRGTTYGESAWQSVTATTAATFFDHGPGPGEDSLTYDSATDTGYYGLVDSGDFITGDALATEIGLSAGTSQNSTTSWMKFYIGPDADCNAFVRRGETAQAYIAFIPQKTTRYDLSWDDIYNAGAVFGTGDNGPYNSGSNVTQDAQATVSTYNFKVRLATCANANPFLGDNDWACADDIGAGSEWNDLIYRVHTDTPNCTDPTEGVSSSETTRHGGPQDGADWAAYTDNDMITASGAGDGSYSWGQETMSSDTTRRVVRGTHGVGFFYIGTSSYAGALYGFRPVLEMIQP